MQAPQESYSLPQLTETLSHLNKFGAVIIGSLYFVLIAVVVIYFLNKFVVKVLLPRLANRRYALVVIFTLYALVLEGTLLFDDTSEEELHLQVCEQGARATD